MANDDEILRHVATEVVNGTDVEQELIQTVAEVKSLKAEVTRLTAENEELRAKLSTAIKFKIGGMHSNHFYVEWRGGRNGDKWTVSNGSSVLNTFWEMEWEPSPSNRSDEFIDRTRFSLDEAFARGKEYLEKHYVP